jgi:hypothetical protein
VTSDLGPAPISDHAGRWNKSIGGSLTGHKAALRRQQSSPSVPACILLALIIQRKHRRRVAGTHANKSRPLLALTCCKATPEPPTFDFSIYAHGPMLRQGYLLPRRTSVHGHTHWRWLKDSPTKASAKGGRDLGPVFGPGHY